jgi:hypothetical protein
MWALILKHNGCGGFRMDQRPSAEWLGRCIEAYRQATQA